MITSNVAQCLFFGVPFWSPYALSLKTSSVLLVIALLNCFTRYGGALKE